MQAKVKTLEEQLRRKDKQVIQLQKQVSALQQRAHRRVKFIRSGISPLTRQQQMRLRGKRVNWKTEDIVRALSVRSHGLKAYQTARLVWKLPLPSISTLRRWANNFSCKEGILHEVISVMKVEAQSMPRWKRVAALSFDEMNVCSEYVYDTKLDKIVSHSKVQVVMVRGICAPWKQPIFYGYDTRMTVQLLNQIICCLEVAGYLIYSITCDLGGENRGLWNSLSISTERTCFINPYDAEREIYVFADPPHMLKLIRNHLIDDGILLQCGVVVNKATFDKMLEYDNSELTNYVQRCQEGT